jgi:4-hydroxybenzoate polyprenyltransferase
MEVPSQPVTRARGLAAVGAILGDIHVEQTLFSLPFVVLSGLLAQRTDRDAGWPYHDRSPYERFAWIVLALVAARSCAMAANRFADASIDAGNPRTARRAVPAGRVSRGAMGVFALATLAVFLFAAWRLNTLCLALAPVALLFLVGYSWTKRITPLCHLWLGTAIGIAPLGAWAGMTGSLASPTPWCLFAAVATWIAGFDVIYACPDVEVDVRDGLHSIPQALGVSRAFRVSEALHVMTVLAFAATGLVTPSLGAAWWIGIAAGAALLVYEHTIVRPGDYRRMATAFFRVNAVFSAVLLAAGIVDLFLRPLQ